ncbi:MAG: sensor histidine kinase [Eubacterium sp.]
MKKYLVPIFKFFQFFLLTAFVVTCSFLIYLDSVNVDVKVLNKNAFITFINVLILSLILCIIDAVRRKFTVEKPVERITQSLKKIKAGDFNEKIKPVAFDNNKFNPIIEDINLLTAELSGVETLRTDFVSNVSHELKTPLSLIENYAALLCSDDLSRQEKEEYACAIKNAAERLSNLVTNVLKLSKLENQQIFPDVKRFNLSEQLCRCMLDFENQWEKKNLEISADIQEDVYIYSDEELLTLVWNNLMSNAVKFTPDGGKISVSLKSDSDECTVKITDTGCGISRETGEHIFEKFYQGDTSHAGGGNGLGLALVKKVIDITKGEISVQSEIGKGSTFTVALSK